MYYFNHNKEKRIEILFADRNWIDRSELDVRDSIMADNITNTLKQDSIKKSLIIMNYRHAYLTPGNCGAYVENKFHGKVANVLINFAVPDFISLMLGKEMVRPIQNGTWDVAFEQIPEDGFAFDLKDSPFGADDFDHFVLPWARERGLKYQDMFIGFIYYKAPAEQYTSQGFSHLFDTENVTELETREQLMPGYSLSNWEFLKAGPYVVEGKEIYSQYAKTSNTLFLWVVMLALLIDGIFIIVAFTRKSRNTNPA